MRRLFTIFFILLGSLIQDQILGQDLGPKQSSRYSVAASNENVILLDTQSGETWILVKKPNLDQPYEWMKIKSAGDQGQGTRDWTGIVQGQKKVDVTMQKADLIKWHEKELSVTNEKIKQLEITLAKIEQSTKDVNEMTITAAKQSVDDAKEQFKLALQILKDHAEHQSEAINNIGRM